MGASDSPLAHARDLVITSLCALEPYFHPKP